MSDKLELAIRMTEEGCILGNDLALALVAALKEAQEVAEGLLSEEPCPKCGMGVSAECYGCKLKGAQEALASIAEPDQTMLREAVATGDSALIIMRLTELLNGIRDKARWLGLPRVPDGSICSACRHLVSDHNLQRATGRTPTLCRKCAITGDICPGGVFEGPEPKR